jgi:hypothetical protein
MTKLKVGCRTESRKKPVKHGNIHSSVLGEKAQWMVQWDGERGLVKQSSRSLTACAETVGFSPGTSAAITAPTTAAAEGERLAASLDLESDDSASSEEEPEVDSNPHVRRRAEHLERLAKEVGKEVEVFFFHFFFFSVAPSLLLLLLLLLFRLGLFFFSITRWSTVGSR